MNNSKPQTILDVEWVLVEEEEVVQALVCAPTKNVVCTPTEDLVGAHTKASQQQDLTRTQAFLIALAYVIAVVTVAMSLSLVSYLSETGLTVFLLVALAGMVVLIVALPIEEDEDEQFWTLGSCPVSQCTPSRSNTLTGR